MLQIDEKNDSRKLDIIAGNIPSSLVFCIDYNLTNEDGDGIDGDEIIRKIRKNNPTCVVVFYSAKLNQAELRALIDNDDSYTYCVFRPNLLAKLRELLEDGII